MKELQIILIIILSSSISYSQGRRPDSDGPRRPSSSTSPVAVSGIAAAKPHIDWSWSNDKAPSGGGATICMSDRLNTSSPTRGSRSAHQCLVEAIKAHRAGNSQLALWWIATTQCHNPGARTAIENAGNASINYLASTYGGHVPGAPTPAPVTPPSPSGLASVSYKFVNSWNVDIKVQIRHGGNQADCDSRPTFIEIIVPARGAKTFTSNGCMCYRRDNDPTNPTGNYQPWSNTCSSNPHDINL